MLGLTLGYRLARAGHRVEIFEAAPEIGGLAVWHDYGPFVWDRFYHCILPQDGQLLGLIRDLGLEGDLRWTKAGTGYYAQGRFFSMSSYLDFLRFPLMSVLDKARLGAAILYATRFADPWRLYRVTAAEWLTRTCGRRCYESFWRPLLKAKFGTYHDQVAAVFIWATLTRLYGARSATTAREKLGYVSGGYRRILGRLKERFRDLGVAVRTSAPVAAVRPAEGGCAVAWSEEGEERSATFDQVFFTGPTRLAREVAGEAFRPHVDRVARDHPTSGAYLGVACLVLVLRRALTPYYVLNIGEESVEATGIIEMTNLIDRFAETRGLSLVYVPRYMDSGDPQFDAPEEALSESLMERGLKRLFTSLDVTDVVYRRVHRARFVQPLPLVRAAGGSREVPALERPFQVLNTSMLTCATLNNNEVVGLVDRFLAKSGSTLGAWRRS
jgi:protoporphyrinogen oxidase